jgi:ankyrin repeat protein
MKSAQRIPMKHGETLEEFLQRSSDALFPDETRAPKPLTVRSRSSDGDTPLHIAALWGDRHAARILLEAGADVDAKGDMSCTPLYFAVMNNHVHVAEVLLEHGADPDAESELNFSPRSLAAHKGDNGMISLLRRYKNGK